MWKGIKLELESNEVCDFVEAPKGIKPISCKWIYKKKGVDGKIETYKVRLVAIKRSSRW